MAERFRKEVLSKYITQGKTTVEIAEKMNFGEDQLKESIEKYCSDEAKDFLRKMQKNDSRRKKEIAAEKKKAAKRREGGAMPIPVATEEEVKDAETSGYDEIKSKVEAQRHVVAEQEVVVKTTIQKYRNSFSELSKKVESFNMTLRVLSQQKEEISKLQEAANQIILEHDTELDKLHRDQEELAKLSGILEEASRVEVFVYHDGTFSDVEIDFNSVFEENAEEISGIKAQLLKEDFIEDLKIKEIAQLAKILVLVKNVERRFDFIFESTELEKVYTEHFKEA